MPSSDEGEFMLADWLNDLERQGWRVVPCPTCSDDALISPDGKLTACAVCDPNWAIAVFEKESAMKVNEYLTRVQAMNAARTSQREEAEKEAQEREEAFRNEVQAFVLTKLPEEVHPFVSYCDYGEEEALMQFSVLLPECAEIRVVCVAHEDYESKTIALAALGLKKYCVVVIRNEIGKNNVQRIGENYQREIRSDVVERYTVDEFDQAVALAMQLGPSTVDQSMVDVMNADLERKAVEYNRLPMCPLLKDKCKGDRCAWFITWVGMDQCAVKVLGYASQSAMGNEG